MTGKQTGAAWSRRTILRAQRLASISTLVLPVATAVLPRQSWNGYRWGRTGPLTVDSPKENAVGGRIDKSEAIARLPLEGTGQPLNQRIGRQNAPGSIKHQCGNAEQSESLADRLRPLQAQSGRDQCTSGKVRT